MADIRDHMYAADSRAGGGFNGSGSAHIEAVSNWTTDNLGAGDQHRIFRAAQDCFVSNFVLIADDLDSDGSPTITLDVGTDTDDDEFIAASTVGQGGGTELTNTASTGTATEAGFPLSEGDYVIISVNAAAATAQAGNTTVHFDVQFV